MAAIDLEILEPANGAVLAGTGAVHFRGRVVGTVPVPLFFKWYASLEAPNPPGAPLPGGTTLDFNATLSVGTHVVTLSAKDKLGDDEASLKAVKNGGMAGGPASESNPRPCLVTVLMAEMIRPLAGATLSKAASQLVAIAPRHWGLPANLGPPLPPPPITYVPNPDYHAINRVKYIWRFRPVGAPAGRATANMTPALNQLLFDGQLALAGNRPAVSFNGALPPALGTGAYQVTLRLEDSSNPAIANEVSRNVTLAA
jgi:hypothetical protein